MKFEVGGIDLSQFGELEIGKASEYEGANPEAPQRERVTLDVVVRLLRDSFAENVRSYQELAAALNTQQAVIKWHDEETSTILVNQTAALISSDLPTNETGWQEMLELHLKFVFYNNGLVTNNLPATFTVAGHTATPLGNVGKWAEEFTTERYSALRSHRSRVGGRITASGWLFVDTTDTLANREAALQAAKTKLITELKSKEGTLLYGDFNNIVRVREFHADVDLPKDAIAWTMSAEFTRFPNESDYALVEFSIEQTDEQNGQVRLSLSGKISAPTEALARTKLAAVRAAIITQYGYEAGKVERDTSNAASVIADTDGQTFIELSFSVEFRKWSTTNITATYTPVGGTLVSLGNVNTWQEDYAAERFDPLRDQRRRGSSTIAATGTLRGNMAETLAVRRATLIAAKDAILAAMNSRRGLLVYTPFSQTVRVERFTADVNQAENGIDWSMTVSRTVFPNESSYALAELQVAKREPQTGEVFITLTGRVQSHSEAAARVKWEAMRATALAQNGFSLINYQALRIESTASSVEADADGAAFIEVAFSEEYRRWDTTNEVATLDGLTLGQVSQWTEKVNSERFTKMRATRRRTECVINARGTLTSTQTDLALRRTELKNKARALKAAANNKENVLVFGTFTATVRLDDFSADFNQTINGIEWTLTANYTMFPDEANYATVEFTAAQRDDYNGEQFLTFAGSIDATSEAVGLAKLAALRTAVLTSRGFLAAQPVRSEVTPSQVEANADGPAFIQLSFNEEYRRWRSDNLSATFTKSGGSAARSLGQVHEWREGYAADRFNAHRSQRQRAAGRVSASGTLTSGNATDDVATRRTALIALKDVLLEEVNCADGTLIYGTFNKVVRISEFTLQVNQAVTGIDWSLTAEFTAFPSETDYSTAEFTADVRDPQTGERTLTFSGRIMATNEAKARARLAALRSTVLSQNAIGTNRRLMREDSTVSQVYANGDKTNGLDTTDITFIELAFAEEYKAWRSDNQAATFTNSAGGSTAVDLGNVNKWDLRYNATRFSELHGHRQHGAGSIEASGTWTGDRAALQAKAQAMLAAVNGKDGTLTYGTYSKLVRVVDFRAEINQAISGIDWQLSVTWSEFPDEAGYALCELEVQQREVIEECEESLSFSGRLRAPSEASARAKLVTLRTAMLAQYSFAAKQQLRIDSTARSVEADTDGTALIELTFSEEYRKRKITGLSWTLQSNDRTDYRTGIVITTLSGTVTAGAADEMTAYTAALAKAESLGANKYDFILSSNVGFDQRQTQTINDIEFVRLTFSYEYQRRDATLTFLEMTVESNDETFGLSTQQAQGSVVAADYEAALAWYQGNVRNQFTGLIRNERLVEGKQREVRPGKDTQFFTRLDFSLQVHVAKLTGAQKIVYAIDTTKHFQTLEKQTTVSGSVYAADAGEANTFLDGILGTLGLVNRTESRRNESHERTGPLAASDYFMKLDFTETFNDRLTGVAAIVECNVTEDVTYSGTRWVEQEIPDNVSIFQGCGTTSGKRTVRASAVAAVPATAESWVNGMRAALLSGTGYEAPRQYTRDWKFVPMTSGVVSGAGANFKAAQVAGVFVESIPNLTYSGPVPDVVSAVSSSLVRAGYVQNESTGLWHKWRARTNADEVLEWFLDETGVP